jgi:hypothetical protein
MDKSSAKRVRHSGGPLVDFLVVGVRRSFYEGVARRCLREAWSRLEEYREAKPSMRLYRGETREREGTTLTEIGTMLGRDHGEVGRWFKGKSPAWANLTLVMTALNADWTNINSLPSKRDRRVAGWIQALSYARKKILREPSGGVDPPTDFDLDCLNALNADDDWLTSRRSTERRKALITRTARRTRLAETSLDLVDRKWGDAWALCMDAYGVTIDPRVWKDGA